LKEHAISACREAGIPILWLGWGLTQDDINGCHLQSCVGSHWIPTSKIIKGYLSLVLILCPSSLKMDQKSKVARSWCEMNGTGALAQEVQPGVIKAWKNRLSEFRGDTEAENLLQARGTRTLLFAGCNTDQCVASSLMDAAWRNYDCLLLSDGTATSSPRFAQEMAEYNIEG
ncbi:hypothetical protein GQ44DRAFT_409268, partial [Phaeosphaeriaceae sp. PMI808]